MFNDPGTGTPKRDFTFTVTPSTDLWLHIGRALLTGTLKEDIVWFQRYASERSVNSLYRLGVGLPLNRLVLNGSVSYAGTRERPGRDRCSRAPARHRI